VLVILPLGAVTNLKRASRTGPFNVMNEGILLVAPSAFAAWI
jgi:hypothetical protein